MDKSASKVSSSQSNIRLASKRDLHAIRIWLEKQDSREVAGNFLCNWSVIKDAQRERKLIAFIDEESGIPVAYQVGGLICPGILQVHSAFQGRGIGRKIVEYCAGIADKENSCFLYIQCKPAASIPFWEKMGFTLLKGDESHHAFRQLRRRHELPIGGRSAEVVIRFYPEDWRWNKTTLPYSAATLSGVETADRVVHLPERVSFFKKLCPEPKDTLVEILVDGERRYFDKAKYTDARRVGVQGCLHGFYIDSIT